MRGEIGVTYVSVSEEGDLNCLYVCNFMYVFIHIFVYVYIIYMYCIYIYVCVCVLSI